MDTSSQQDRRQHPRTRISLPVVLNVGTKRYLSRSLNLSPIGAKIRTNAQLKIGTPVRLEVVPPEGPPLRIGAIVWRVDADGLAFLFNSAIQHRLLRAS